MSNPQAELEPRQKHRHESGDYLLDHEGRCWFCGRKPAVESQEGEVTVEVATESKPQAEVEEAQPECTISIGREDGTFTGPISMEEFERRAEDIIEAPRKPDYGVIDRNTGEVVQLSLLGAEWEQYKVETLRLSLSGGDEFIKSMFDELVDGELSPGAIVEVVCRGIVKEHAPVFKKDGHEGKTVILLEVVRRITVLGHMTAKVEAGQNVDGEAKVLEEGTEGGSGDTEAAPDEADGADGETAGEEEATDAE